MWQLFTERARRVVLLGQEEAGKMNSNRVGTEHLLLGLLCENDGVAAQVLQKMGASLQLVRQEIEAEIEPSEEGASSEPTLTPRAKRVLELAADEARRMRHNYIGTEHLLLALLREKDGIAANVLRKLGLNLEATRQQVMEYLGPDTPPTPATIPHPMTSQIIHLGKYPEKTDWILPLLVRLLPRELRAMGQQLRQLNKEKDAAILLDDYETAAKWRDAARELEKRMEEFADQWEQAMEQPMPSGAKFDLMPVTVEIVITQIEAAIDALSSGDLEKLAEIKQRLAVLKDSLRGEAADE